MLEQLLQEYKKTFNEQFPLMLCRGCDDDEIMEIKTICAEAVAADTASTNNDKRNLFIV